MTSQLELWHLVLLALSVLGGYWALTKIIAAQFQRSLDERFQAQHTAFKLQNEQLNQRLDVLDAASKQDVGQWQRVERELLNLKAELPLHYVRREDYVQAVATIMSKLDSMALRFENILLKGENRDNRR